MAAAAIPPAPTTAKPIRTPTEFPGQAAATIENGARAAASIIPSVTSDRQIARTPAGHPGKRRTIVIRTSSSNRPGSTMPMIVAPPPAAASETGPGRSGRWKSRAQPIAFSKKAARKSKETDTSSSGRPCENGIGVERRC